MLQSAFTKPRPVSEDYSSEGHDSTAFLLQPFLQLPICLLYLLFQLLHAQTMSHKHRVETLSCNTYCTAC